DSRKDVSFGVRFSPFAEVDPHVGPRILEGRRKGMLERREAKREQMQRNRERRDAWTLELQRHGLEHIDREVGWLEDLITHERNTSSHPTSTPGAQDRRRTPKEH